MLARRRHSGPMVCWLMVLIAVPALAQQPPAGSQPPPQPKTPPAARQQEPPPPVGQLPAPLNEITADLRQLEETGYFKLVKVEFGRTRFHNEEALLWTVRVVKPIHCRHALLVLRRIADVRFYRTLPTHRKELHMAQLHYPMWIESDAANNLSLDRDEEFQLWILLDHQLIHRLDIDKADTLEFRPMPERTLR